MRRVRIQPVSLDGVNLSELRNAASDEGFGFLDRLAGDWLSGVNRFAASGELLLGAFNGRRLVGIGGLNREPYEPDPRVARLRHLYVAQDIRRQGVGTILVDGLLGHAQGLFREVRLRTDHPEAAAFYEALGFQRLAISTATHSIVLPLDPDGDVANGCTKRGAVRRSPVRPNP
jgi:GNAT superfamily N-acetyltransferase